MFELQGSLETQCTCVQLCAMLLWPCPDIGFVHVNYVILSPIGVRLCASSYLIGL